MNTDQILQEVNVIFADVLDNENISLTRTTTANEVEDWDSLNHIHLIVATERHFKLRFTSAEINQWKNIGEMCDLIAKKLSR